MIDNQVYWANHFHPVHTVLSSNLMSLASRRCKIVLVNMLKLFIDVITKKHIVRMIPVTINNLEYIIKKTQI